VTEERRPRLPWKTVRVAAGVCARFVRDANCRRMAEIPVGRTFAVPVFVQ
jgi:hypothetical protein